MLINRSKDQQLEKHTNVYLTMAKSLAEARLRETFLLYPVSLSKVSQTLNHFSHG
jgi:hypothetical protein